MMTEIEIHGEGVTRFTFDENGEPGSFEKGFLIVAKFDEADNVLLQLDDKTKTSLPKDELIRVLEFLTKSEHE